jgi:outer membrane protein assembly factor BamB
MTTARPWKLRFTPARTAYRLVLVSMVVASAAVAAEPTQTFAFVPQWTLPLRRNAELGRLTERTAPVLNGELAYVASLGGELLILERDRGFPYLPTKKLGGGVDGALAHGRAKIVVGDTKGTLLALNARDASEAWRFTTGAEWLSPPVVVRGKVIAFSGNETVYALGETDGRELWHYTRSGDEKLTIHGVATPVVSGDEVFVGFADGYFAVLDLGSGRPKWTRKLRTRDRFYDVDAPPYVDDALVIVASYDGRIHALDRASGDTRWILPMGSYGGFAADEENLYFAGLDSHVYAIARADGKVLWSTPFEKGIGTRPQLWNDVLVVTTSHDPLLAIDKKTGTILDRVRLGAGSVANVAVADDGFVLALSNYGNLYAYRLMRKIATNVPEPIRLWTGSVRFVPRAR